MTSNAEILLAAQLEQAGIPFEREYPFAASMGRRWRSDFHIWDDREEASFLLIEIDGGSWVEGRHTRGKGFANDAEKASAAAILGYRVIRCVPEQVEDGRCLSWIKAALGIEERAA